MPARAVATRIGREQGRPTMWLRWMVAGLLGVSAWAGAQEPATEVAVLSTLHRMHGDVPGYGLDVLAGDLEALAPDVLCIEVRPDRLAERAPEQVKIEYPEVVYPMLEQGGYRVYPMEPAEPAYSVMVEPYRAAQEAFVAGQPEASAAFDAYVEGMYAALRAYWTSSARVNDAVTDAHMRAKHMLQDALFGTAEAEGWERWNRHFLAVVDRALDENPGKRVVVLVGAEHAYWLRDRLRGRPGIRLLGTVESPERRPRKPQAVPGE
ncbi:hypothetical protein H0E84_09140 [Luteimonas sp. SJ-92]|uniref:TraB/GumN family protein n=1 Tax=Luteimonas salinisoli TaxID=2752307 RepID=A0A853JDA7_9GAMM|nr:hypothetical protein [Luteimonas salinisoli]NZA26550.1 hypothetical protein [Luteimonas salinisoli]